MCPACRTARSGAVFAIVAAFVGLKGIQYVARVATYLPLIPVVLLVILLVHTAGGVGSFSLKSLSPADAPATAVSAATLTAWGVVGALCTYVVGFFATAGAAGADIAANGRNEKDAQLGGIGGIVLPTVLAGAATFLIVAGAYGAHLVKPEHIGTLNPVTLMPDVIGGFALRMLP